MKTSPIVSIFNEFLKGRNLFPEFTKYLETGELSEDMDSVEYPMGFVLTLCLADGETPIPQRLGFVPTKGAIAAFKRAAKKQPRNRKLDLYLKLLELSGGPTPAKG